MTKSQFLMGAVAIGATLLAAPALAGNMASHDAMAPTSATTASNAMAPAGGMPADTHKRKHKKHMTTMAPAGGMAPSNTMAPSNSMGGSH